MSEGIDYSSTQHVLEEIQRESSHLLQFAQETGLQADPNGSITVAELWESLKLWYIENGTLTIDTGARGAQKMVWQDQPSKSDRNVKVQNQVVARFLEIFSKAKKGTRRPPGSNNAETILTGIKICCPETDQRDQQNNGTEGISASTQFSNWVPSDHQLTNGNGQLANAVIFSTAPTSPLTVPSLVPSSELTNGLDLLQSGTFGTHVGHGTQFADKKLISEDEDDEWITLTDAEIQESNNASS